MEVVGSPRAVRFITSREDEEKKEIVYPYEHWLSALQLGKVAARLWTIQPFCSIQLQKMVSLFFQFPALPVFSTIILPLSFEEYIESSHFKGEEDVASRIYEDLKRGYATFNGENLVERAWRNLSRSDFASFFDASQSLHLQKEWVEIEKDVRKEFVGQVFPKFVEEACTGMDADVRRAFLGSFYQGSGTIFSTIRHLDRGGVLPFRTMDNRGKVIQSEQGTLFIYEATLGEQLFVRNEGGMELQYGSLAENMVATVDFTRRRGTIHVSSFSNPFYGDQILPSK